EATNRPPAALARGQRLGRDAVPDLEGPLALIAAVVVGRHRHSLQQKGACPRPDFPTARSDAVAREYSTHPEWLLPAGPLPTGFPIAAAHPPCYHFALFVRLFRLEVHGPPEGTWMLRAFEDETPRVHETAFVEASAPGIGDVEPGAPPRGG